LPAIAHFNSGPVGILIGATAAVAYYVYDHQKEQQEAKAAASRTETCPPAANTEKE
jgi:hypothetical protein